MQSHNSPNRECWRAPAQCDALHLGWHDFKAVPSHATILCVIYPVLGIVLFRLVLGYSVLPLLFPLAAGFALIGPFAGLGLYELSRRREQGDVVALCVSVVAFPLMLDRHTTAIDAIRTSVRVAMKNPLPIAVWGLIVAALLVIGSLPLFVGLAVVLPVLGHATWHLYRRAVEPDPIPAQDRPRPPKEGHRYAADFPANLFPWSRER